LVLYQIDICEFIKDVFEIDKLYFFHKLVKK